MQVFFIFSLSFLLFFHDITSGTFRAKKTPALIKSSHQKIVEKWGKNELSLLYSSFITGYGTRYLKETKPQLEKLSLLHLSTPSGLHLSVLVKMFQMAGLKHLFLLSLFTLLWVPGFEALKRMIWFRNINYISHDTGFSFLLTFIIDMGLGNFYQNSLSFIFSFLFLGIIIFSRKQLFIYLFLGNILVNFFLQQNTNLLTLFVNFPISLIVSLAFPILALNYFFPYFDYLDGACHFFMSCFQTILNYLFKLSHYFPQIGPDNLVILSLFIFLMKKELFKTLLFLNLIFYSTSTNQNKYQYHLSNKKYFHSLSAESDQCRAEFQESFWEVKCLGARKKRSALVNHRLRK
ncbi:MAG: hypothetical protein JNM93_02205 [Bacteriovoracaceae bacterium]|nr:hypothetical protein [Bacteriovoracaceae bacterium]